MASKYDGKTGERLDRYRVTPGKKVRLGDLGTADLHPDGLNEDEAVALLEKGVHRLAKLQEKLYISKESAILIVLQAMDAGGKDSTIEHVISGVNPQGVRVTSFKAPTPEELAHDFLWRVSKALPARGMIGVFNRSHYEDVLVSRVHPGLVNRPGLPPDASTDPEFWDKRLEDIAAFEHHLTREGTRIVKIFLNISRDEQRKRLLARLDDPEKTWKFDPGDMKERAFWPAYMEAYEAAIGATATKRAPWYVVPADRKWYARLVVVEAIIEAFSGLSLEPPDLSPEQREALGKARRALLA